MKKKILFIGFMINIITPCWGDFTLSDRTFEKELYLLEQEKDDSLAKKETDLAPSSQEDHDDQIELTPSGDLQQELTWFDQVKTLSGYFTQNSSQMRESRSWQGRFFLKVPSYLHWVTELPFHEEIVCDGTSVWIYDLSLSRITRYPQVQYSQSFLPLIFDADSRNKLFQSRQIFTNKNSEQWEFKPIDDQTSFSLIRILIEHRKLKRIDLWDQLGHRIDLHFSDVVLNRPISSHHFSFKVPKGVEFVDLTSSSSLEKGGA